MPHACTQVRDPKAVMAAAPASGPPQGVTHISEEMNESPYCNEPVNHWAAAKLTVYNPQDFGPPCGRCMGVCKQKHPGMHKGPGPS
jgi:hypothetical protein